jgi:hypothetical protein
MRGGEAAEPPLERILRLLVAPHGSTASVEVRRASADLGRDPSGLTVLVLPTMQRPRFLVSATNGRALRRVLMSYGALRPVRTRALRYSVAFAAQVGLLGSGLGEKVEVGCSPIMDDGEGSMHLLGRLQRLLGEPELLMAVGVGRVDHHYKPTIQLFRLDGTPRAFAKVGWTEATAELVRNEAATLQRVGAAPAEGGSVAAPDLIGTFEWGRAPVLVTAPLPARVRAVSATDDRVAAARIVEGAVHRTPFPTSDYHTRLMERLSSVPPAPRRTTVEAALQRLLVEAGSTPWSFTPWHGDWVPWNVASSSGQLYAWDWEHAAVEAPAGFDQLHWRVSVGHQLQGKAFAAAAMAACVRMLGFEAEARAHLLDAYLIELGVRSLLIDGSAPGDQEVELYPGLFDLLDESVAR